MASQVIMPKLSPTMEEGVVSRWLKKEGDKVSMGEPLAEIDTDKATMEMQALGDGVLRKILIQEGESAPLGQLIAIIGEPDEDISSISSPAPAKEKKEDAEEPKQAKPTETEAHVGGNGRQASAPVAQPATSAQTATPATGRLIVSPLAARMAAESGIDLRSVNGSGPGGRIIKRDVEGLISEQGSATQPGAATKQTHLRAVGSVAQKSAITTASAFRDEPAS